MMRMAPAVLGVGAEDFVPVAQIIVVVAPHFFGAVIRMTN